MSPYLFFRAFPALVCLALSSQAASITWTKDSITADGNVVTSGTLVEAANFGGSGVADVTVNTVTFLGIDFTNSGSPGNLTGLTYDTAASATSSTGGNIDTLLTTLAYKVGAKTQSVSLTGLNPGTEYLVQFFVKHSTTDRANIINDGNGNTVTVSHGGEFATGTFTADGTTQSLTFENPSGSQLWSGYQLRALSALPDTPPTLAASDIVDDASGGPVSVDTEVTYTVTFSEDMDAATVDGTDFGNAGSSAINFGTIEETSPGVFTVPVTPTGSGTLQLAVLEGASLADRYGNLLDTSTAILDDTTLSVETPPPYVPKHHDVFIIAGQSNADGRGPNSQLTGSLAEFAGLQPDALIHYANPAYSNADKSRYQEWVTLEPGYSRAPGNGGPLPTGTFSVEIGAGKVLSDAYPTPAFIKVTEGGTALGVPGSDWYPAPLDSPDVGPLYQLLIESTEQALAEITANGDTYTVRALFWHQGESDGSRTAEYGGLLTTLIESVRRDLDMPNLRFMVGELSPTKPQSFRDVQWNVARSVPNTWFISSRGLATSDGTHFTAPAMITFGQRLGHALRPDRNTLDFESPAYGIGALHRQDEWAATLGHSSELEVIATSDQGEYAAGQAAGHSGVSGAFHGTRRDLLPLAGARVMQADFFPGDAGFDDEGDTDSSLLVAGWGTDADNDGEFTDSEAAIGFGLHDSGAFRVQIGSQNYLTSSFAYQSDRWYRLTLAWSEPDAGGIRSVGLYARDLSSGADLNSGMRILSFNASSAEFEGNAVRWSGLGCSATRGLIDNIRIVPNGFAQWANTLYPSLTGGFFGDDDRDGIGNAVEFAFGLNPTISNPSTDLPQPVFGQDAATVSFAPLTTQPGILHRVEWSRDLSLWNSVSGNESNGLLEFTVPTSGESSIFIRHRVEVSE